MLRHQAAARTAHEQQPRVAERHQPLADVTHRLAVIQDHLVEARVLRGPVDDDERNVPVRREIERPARRGARQQDQAVDAVVDEFLQAIEFGGRIVAAEHMHDAVAVARGNFLERLGQCVEIRG